MCITKLGMKNIKRRRETSKKKSKNSIIYFFANFTLRGLKWLLAVKSSRKFCIRGKPQLALIQDTAVQSPARSSRGSRARQEAWCGWIKRLYFTFHNPTVGCFKRRVNVTDFVASTEIGKTMVYILCKICLFCDYGNSRHTAPKVLGPHDLTRGPATFTASCTKAAWPRRVIPVTVCVSFWIHRCFNVFSVRCSGDKIVFAAKIGSSDPIPPWESIYRCVSIVSIYLCAIAIQ